MPTYTFVNKDTGEEWTDIMSIASRQKFLDDNPNVSQKIIPRKTGDGIIAGVGIKADEGFRDILREIKNNNPGNTIDVI